MMNFWAAVRWWEESQLRALVLSSLFLQLFLFFTAATRMLRIPSWLRSCIWLAYLGSDAVAIYALAALFNRHKVAPPADGAKSRSILEVLWAPVLLIHLGGPVSISAYDMEDNELWARHVLTLLSQVSVSIYVFYRSWPANGEKLLFQTAILLFTIGIIRSGFKPWALKRASINCLLPTRESLYGRRKMFRFFDELSFYWAQLTSNAAFVEADGAEFVDKEQEGSAAAAAAKVTVADVRGKNSGATPEYISIHEYVRQAKNCVDINKNYVLENDINEKRTRRYALVPLCVDSFMTLYKMSISTTENYFGAYRQPGPHLLGDSVLHYSDRLKALRYFLELDDFDRVHTLETTLRRMFNLLYTKEKLDWTSLGDYTRYVAIALSFAAIGMFAKAQKYGYNKDDVSITYILLCFNAAMELFQCCTTPMVEALGELRKILRAATSVAVTSAKVAAQQNLVSFVARRKRPTRLMMLAALVGFDDYVNKHWHVGHGSSSHSHTILMLVLRQLEDGWKEYICDAASFRRFNDRRGHWTLSRRCHQHVVQGCSNPAQVMLRRSLQLPFDESLVIWHIATDLCFYHPDAAVPPPPAQECVATASREISNYMVYLFFLHPEMLIPGARKDVLTVACDDVHLMCKYDDTPPLDERSLAQGIIHKQRQAPWLFSDIISTLLPEACKLAEALMEIRDVEQRWKIIESVWVEMLCYSASNCRGYLHAKSLGQGGEFLSYVWLLLSHMGMDTFADRFHRPAPFEEDEASAGGSSTSSRQDGVPPVPEEITTAMV